MKSQWKKDWWLGGGWQHEIEVRNLTGPTSCKDLLIEVTEMSRLHGNPDSCQVNLILQCQSQAVEQQTKERRRKRGNGVNKKVKRKREGRKEGGKSKWKEGGRK